MFEKKSNKIALVNKDKNPSKLNHKTNFATARGSTCKCA